ncbi:hypothetical protein EDB83DRAFT_2525764 [Lactarius deliciosus]|nr:hypothetical protein EDB83DRAFT_2525764 [Lactarius deliciosus]
MSQAFDNINATEADIGTSRGVHLYPPQSAPTQEPRGMSNFVDGSGPIFSMYLEMATEEDKKMAESWKADADGILIFTGLFSAAVASLISVSIQDIRPNPQDTSNFYLANIYRTLADPASNISDSLPASPPPFSPPNYAIWVNALLFLSLVISISCALLATLLQQWARRYLKVTQPRYSLHKRARIRAFFAEGVDQFLLPSAVEALPTLLHVSLFLFFAGISVFLWNVDLTIFKAVVSWIGICTALYGFITFFPIFRHDSPYNTPLSLPAWHIVAAISFVTFRVLRWFTLSTVFCFPCICFGLFDLGRVAAKASSRFKSLEKSCRRLLLQGMQKTVEKTALDSPSEIDSRAFLWTFDSLDEDHELERFFSGLPGFRSSKVVDDPLPRLTEEQKEKFSTALEGLFDRTFSSDLLPESVKNWRAIICARALDPAFFPHKYDRVMLSIMFENQCRGLQTSKFGCIVRGWGNGGNQGTGLVTEAIVTSIIGMVERRDDSWFILASSVLGVPESVLRDYAANSLSLAILIHVVCQQFNHFRKPFWPRFWIWDVLYAASKFDVQDTSPELQHEFCSLWNQIVFKARNDDDREMAYRILSPIRHIYLTLHQDTDSARTRLSAFTHGLDDILFEPSSYPVCKVAGHIHDNSAILHDNAALVPSITSPAASPLSVSSPLRLIESLADAQPLDNFHPIHQPSIDSPGVPVPSPTSSTASAIQDTVKSGITTLHPTPETSISPPLLPTSPPAVIALRQHAGPPTPSDPPTFPPLASLGRVPDNMLPTGAPLSSLSDDPILDLTGPIIVAAPPSASPGPTSAPNLDAATEDDGSQKSGFQNDNDALDPFSTRAIHANIMPILDRPPLLLVTDSDVVITGPSVREPDAERTGDHLRHPSHGQYDIV